MARIGISEQQVIDAAEGLVASGQAVTVSAVREALGSGSYSTINAHLGKWREASGGDRSASDIPDMPEAVGRAARAFWGVAWKDAQAGIQGERDALDAARRTLARERQDMTGEITRLEAENARQGDALTRMRTALDQADAARQEADTATNALRVDAARLDERAKAAEATAQALRVDNARLDKRAKAADTRAETLDTARHQLAGEVLRLEADIARQSEALERLRIASEQADAARLGEAAARRSAEDTTQTLRVEQARVLERATGAEALGASLQVELDKLHARLQEVAAKITPPKAPPARARKKPQSKPPASSADPE